jgi:hypothetical protein
MFLVDEPSACLVAEPFELFVSDWAGAVRGKPTSKVATTTHATKCRDEPKKIETKREDLLGTIVLFHVGVQTRSNERNLISSRTGGDQKSLPLNENCATPVVLKILFAEGSGMAPTPVF